MIPCDSSRTRRNRRIMTDVSFWMHVNIFTVEQAAALWCGIDPATLSPLNSQNHSELLALKQMLSAGILAKELAADTSTNGLSIIGDHSKSLVSRSALEAFAAKKRLFPGFLFDTLMPFAQAPRLPIKGHSSLGQQAPAPPINRGGRPPEYDWDSFTMEIIRRANTPDGLPITQAELVREMLDWSVSVNGKEPAESAVKSRISKIYRYIEAAKNSTG